MLVLLRFPLPLALVGPRLTGGAVGVMSRFAGTRGGAVGVTSTSGPGGLTTQTFARDSALDLPVTAPQVKRDISIILFPITSISP